MPDAATTSPDFHIRPATPGDLPELLELYIELNSVNADLPDPERVAAVLEEMLATPRLSCFVAGSAGGLVGSCTMIVVSNLTHGARPFGVIENVVTRREWRGRGVGSALMRHALRTAWAADCHKVMLMSGASRVAAHRFYESLGFVSNTKVGFVATPETAPCGWPGDQT